MALMRSGAFGARPRLLSIGMRASRDDSADEKASRAWDNGARAPPKTIPDESEFVY
jgi:hypothetical protein